MRRMTAIRRKRDDDSTFHSASQCSGSLALDASQASMVALDASTIGDDSSMPRRRRKRRRVNILEQLQQIDISNSEGVPNQILEKAVADDNSQTLTSSDSEDDGDSQIIPPSDVELAERSAMRDLVFGRPRDPPPPNPVDRKIQLLVRKSLENVQKGAHPMIIGENNIASSKDDMHIDPVYTKPSDPSFFDNFSGPVTQPTAAMPVANGSLPPRSAFARARSNSLPSMEDLLGEESMKLS